MINGAINMTKDFLGQLLSDDTVAEIMINGASQVYVERGGKIERCDNIFDSEKDIYLLIETILKPLNKIVDENHPYADARLPDGSRVNIVVPPVSLSGPMITIRKFSNKCLEGSNLVSFDALSNNMLDFLKLCVENRKNIVIAGGTGSGKTTVLNILSSFILEAERIITIEDTAELRLNQEHVGKLESRPADIDGKGAVSIRQLLSNSLRMRPDRIIVGECRGGEALDMLQAMNTGHNGSMTTVHANSPRDCLKRLETMVMMAGFELPIRAIREQIASAVNVIVQVSRLGDGSRKIVNISEVSGMEGDVVTLSPIFEFKQTEVDKATGKIEGIFSATQNIPSFIEEIKAKGISVNMGIFK